MMADFEQLIDVLDGWQAGGESRQACSRMAAASLRLRLQSIDEPRPGLASPSQPWPT